MEELYAHICIYIYIYKSFQINTRFDIVDKLHFTLDRPHMQFKDLKFMGEQSCCYLIKINLN